MGTGMSLGEPIDLSTYSSNGTANATYTSKAPDSAKPTCWIRNINGTCTEEQKEKIFKGEGAVINGVLYDRASGWRAPDSSISIEAGYPGTVPPAMTATFFPSSDFNGAAKTTQEAPTGVYVATSTPSISQKGTSSLRIMASLPLLIFCFTMVLSQTQWL